MSPLWQRLQPPVARWSYRSYYSLLSAYSVASIASVLSAGSAGSLLSIGSSGSILSIGSTGSILSIGSAGSILCIGGEGSIMKVGRRRGKEGSDLAAVPVPPARTVQGYANASRQPDGRYRPEHVISQPGHASPFHSTPISALLTPMGLQG